MEAKRYTSFIKVIAILCVAFIVLAVAVVLTVDRIVVSQAESSMVEVHEATTYHADSIVILGAGVRDDGSPSAILKERLDTGLELYEAQAAPHIIVTGSGIQKMKKDSPIPSEIDVMSSYLKEHGVPEGAISLDPTGYSTSKSMINVSSDPFNQDRIVIVTQSFHLPRSIMLARHMDMDAIGVPSEKHIYPEQVWWSSREIAARFKDWVRCEFNLI